MQQCRDLRLALDDVRVYEVRQVLGHRLCLDALRLRNTHHGLCERHDVDTCQVTLQLAPDLGGCVAPAQQLEDHDC